MLNVYKDELTQATYTPEHAARRRRIKAATVTKTVKKKLNDDALLQRLEGLTAPDNEVPPPKAGARRR